MHLYSVYDPEVVHCHGIRSSLIALLAGRRPIVHLHGSGALPSDPRMYSSLRRLGLRLIPGVAAAAFTASPGMGKRWIFQPDVSPKLSSIERLPFPDEKGPAAFLWLGRLEDQKRPDLFVRAMAEVGRKKPVVGVLAGTGSLQPQLRTLAAELKAPVQFLGDRADIVSLLRRAWAVVLFTRFEGMPLSVEEAMWAGRAIVASRIPPLEWLVGDAGCLVDDLESAVQALMALTEPSVAQRYGRAAADRVRLLLRGCPWAAVEELYANRVGKVVGE